jgi:hypothetical protein
VNKGGPRAAAACSARLPGPPCPPRSSAESNARGAKNINIDTNFNFDGSLSNGAVRGNAVIGTSDTGTIATTNSINNNTGITTVFQNSGNNSLFQQTTSINITLQH